MMPIPNPLDIETIFSEYKNKVYHLALSITRNEKDAEDILQNAFLKIIKNLAYFRKESNLSTWIYKITYNEALMLLRKRSGQIRLKKHPGLFVNWSKLPDEQLLDSEFKERLDNSIRHMPIKYRMPLLLNKVEGLSIRESARILGLKGDSLKTRLRRGRLNVQREITDYFKDKEQKQEKPAKRCGIWTEFIYNYAKGYLSKRKQRAFREHIKDCRGCKSFLGTYVKAIDITEALECQDIPAQLKDKIETFILKISEPFCLPKHLNKRKGVE